MVPGQGVGSLPVPQPGIFIVPEPPLKHFSPTDPLYAEWPKIDWILLQIYI
jgi:hypothetical protein